MLKLTIIFALLFSTMYGQKRVVNVSEKTKESIENPASDFRVIEPKMDTLNLTKEKVFSLLIEYSGEMNSLHLIDYPSETYAEQNKLKEPETNEDYKALSDEDWVKFNVIIPKHEVLKEAVLNNKIIIKLKITSDRITHTEIYADGKLIKTLYYRIE